MEQPSTALQPAVPRELGTAPHILEVTETGVAHVYKVGTGTFSCGRDPDADIVVNCPGASRNHARFEVRNGGARLIDLGSSNGTYLNGQRLAGQEVLKEGDEVRIGSIVLKVKLKAAPAASAGGATQVFKSAPLGVAKLKLPNAPPRLLPLFAGEQFIGRHADCDLVIPRADVSRRHAQVLVTEEELVVTDLESSNGTLVNHRPISGATRLPWGTTLEIGDNTLEFQLLGERRAEPVDRPTLIGNVAALRQLANDAGYGDDDERETQASPNPAKARPAGGRSNTGQRPITGQRPATGQRSASGLRPAAGRSAVPSPHEGAHEMTQAELRAAAPSRWPIGVALGVAALALGGIAVAFLMRSPPTPAASKLGAAQVSSSPAGASLFVDGRVSTLRTPARVELAPDTMHLLEARLAGYKPRSLEVNVHPGEQVVLDFALEPDGSAPAPAPGPANPKAPEPAPTPVASAKNPPGPGPAKAPPAKPPPAKPEPAKPEAKVETAKAPTGNTALLDVDSRPAADVYLGNKLLGHTPLKAVTVPAGELVLDLRNKQLGLHKQVKVKARPGEHEGTEALFRKGKVFFNITPWAELTLGEQELGRSPTTVELYEGSYQVNASNGDLGVEKTFSVVVEPDKTVKVEQELK